MRSGRERAALAGLEIHDVVAERAARQRKRGIAAPRHSSGEVDAESCDWPLPCRRSIGRRDRPARRASMALTAVVTWAEARRSVSECRAAGAYRRAGAASAAQSRTLSVAGLMPITASPHAEQQAVDDARRRCPADRRSDDSVAAAWRAVQASPMRVAEARRRRGIWRRRRSGLGRA